MVKIKLKKNNTKKYEKSKKGKYYSKKNRFNKMKGGVLSKKNKEDIEKLKNNELESLDISHIDSEVDVEGVNEILDALKKNNTLTTLKTLNISSIKLNTIGAIKFAEVLKNNETLTTLDMSNNNIEDVGAQAIKELLESNKSITKIDISNNFISENFIKDFALSKLKYNSNTTNTTKTRRQIIMVPQKEYKNNSHLSNYSNSFYQKFLKEIGHYIIKKIICMDSGACLAFGIYSDIIKKYFDNFTSFEYVDETDYIKRISSNTVNGVIDLIKYINYDNRDYVYTSYAILKSMKNIKTSYPDNLMYEYNVGMFINCLNKIYPCFIETYGLYKFKDETHLEIYNEVFMYNNYGDTMLLKQLEQINLIDYNIGCESYRLLVLLIQNIKGGIPLGDVVKSNKIFLNNELIMLLFQIYIPLYTVRDYFTHYDLHSDNVLIYEPKKDYYIEYHYHFTKNDIFLDLNKKEEDKKDIVISFKSSYIAKIIDYGRSYFNYSKTFFTNFKEADDSNSSKVLDEICTSNKCGCSNKAQIGCCGSEYGLGALNVIDEKSKHYITPSKKNISSDLRLLFHLIDKKLNSSDLKKFDWITKITYIMEYGTPEKETDKTKPENISNIKDLAKILIKKISSDDFKKKNNGLYLSKIKLGDLHIYVDELKSMEYIPEQKLENMFP